MLKPLIGISGRALRRIHIDAHHLDLVERVLRKYARDACSEQFPFEDHDLHYQCVLP